MRSLFGLAVLLLLAFSVDARTEETLQNDLSRGQLFAKFILPSVPDGPHILSLDRDFVFPADVVALQSSGRPFVVGIDVSHHNTDGCNCEINWMEVFDAGARFVYIKASQGQGADPRLSINVKGVNVAPASKKLLKGTYHFMSADGAGDVQGQFYVDNLDRKLASVGAKREPDDLPPVIDLEWDHRVDSHGQPIPCSDGKIHPDCWELVAADEIIVRLNAWLTRVKSLTGRNPFVYTARSWVDDRIKDESKFTRVGAKVWIANYLRHDRTGSKTVVTVDPAVPTGSRAPLWQFTDRAQVPNQAHLGGVDTSIFKGALADFRTAMELPQ